MDFSELFSSVSITIGGGLGWYCRECNQRNDSDSKPKQCSGVYKIPNFPRIRQLLEEDDLSLSLAELCILWEDGDLKDLEKQREVEHYVYGYSQDRYTAFSIVIERTFSEEGMFKEQQCNGTRFVHENRPGRHLEEHDAEFLSIWEELTE